MRRSSRGQWLCIEKSLEFVIRETRECIGHTLSHSLPLLSALWEAKKAIDESRLIPMEDSLPVPVQLYGTGTCQSEFRLREQAVISQ